MRRPCAEPGCAVLVTDGPRCGPHRLRRGGRPWRRLRAAVLLVEPMCRLCGAAATEVDHIVALADGGAELDVLNVRPLCAACHRAV